ncbi:MAG: family 16 glycosylhydrolase [Fibrobacterales bacterium]
MTHIRLLLLTSITSFFLVGCLGADPADSSSVGGSSEEVLSSEESSESSEGITMDSSGEESSEGGSSESKPSEVSSSSVVVESSSKELSSEGASSIVMSSEENSSGTVSTDESSSDVMSSEAVVDTDMPMYDDFTFVFEDEFDTFDDSMWEKSDGGWMDNESNFEVENTDVNDGKMVLTMRRDNPSEKVSWSQRNTRNPDGKEVIERVFSSGELRSHRQYLYGRFVAPIKVSDNAEYYLSTMFLYRVPSDDRWLEIDIELMSGNKDRPTTNMLIDWDGAENWAHLVYGGDASDFNGAKGFEEFVKIEDKVFVHTETHEYAIEWTPDRIAWYIDDVLIREFTNKDQIPNEPMHIMFNFWIFGPLTGNYPADYLDGGIEPTTEYEYFRYYKWNGEDEYEHPAWCGNKTWNGTRCE